MNGAGCRHWIGTDTSGRRCKAEPEGLLPYCPKHIEIQRRRLSKYLEKQRVSEARANAAWMERNAYRIPQMKVHLERAKAEYARRTDSAVADRAAYGGSTHAAVTRSQQSKLSDSNVARVVELQRIIEKLEADITRASGGAS